MMQKCDAACLMKGDKTFFGDVERVSVVRDTTTIYFVDGSTMDFGNDSEITFWED